MEDSVVVLLMQPSFSLPPSLGLALDEEGFLADDDHLLQSTSHPFVSAAGDICSLLLPHPPVSLPSSLLPSLPPQASPSTRMAFWL